MRACFLAVADGCDELRLDSSDLRSLADLTAESANLLDQIDRAHLLHGDLIPGNVMVDPEHPDRGVTGIFDCDRVWWGDPVADWTMLAVERLPREDAAGFWIGYGRDLTVGEPAQARRRLYRAYGLGEARLEHARLGRTDQVASTYAAIHDLGAMKGLGVARTLGGRRPTNGADVAHDTRRGQVSAPAGRARWRDEGRSGRDRG